LLLPLQGPAFTYEVIIVDDGSKDSTAAVAMGFVKRHGVDAVRLLRLPYNCGKGRAVREGMLIARGELCLMMDADGATRVSDMEQLEAAIKVCSSLSKVALRHTHMLLA
jgi:dolichyl-phosphate beta-glucosyltransferase